MKKQKFYIFSFVIILIISTILIYILHKTNNSSNLPLQSLSFEIINEDVISHKEIKQINLGSTIPVDIAYTNSNIYLLSYDYLQIIDTTGLEINKTSIENNPTCLYVNESNIFIGYKNHIMLLSKNGLIINKSNLISNNTYFTSISASNSKIFVADAGNKEIVVFNYSLEIINSFKGESGVSDKHGFILPGKHFAIALNKNNELWAVNPGIHALQNYSENGKLRGYWNKSSFNLDGFSGCCNPSYISFLSNNYFVTSEKGLVRIKIHKPSGEFYSVVAPNKSFNGKKAPAITVDENNNIIALDFNSNTIRFFESKK